LQDIQHAMVPLYTVQEISQQHSACLREIKQAIDVLMPQKDASESDENVVINSFDDFEELEFAQKNKEVLFASFEQYVSERLKPCMGSMIFLGDIYRDVESYGYAMSYKSFTDHFDKIVDRKKINEKEWSDVFKKVSQHAEPANGGSKRGGVLNRATYENLTFKNMRKDTDTEFRGIGKSYLAPDLKPEQLQQYLSANLQPCPGSMVFVSDIYTDAQNVEKNTFGNQSFRAFARLLKKCMTQKIADDEEWSRVWHDPKFYIRGTVDTCRSVYNNLTFKNHRVLESPTTALEGEASPSSSNTEPQNSKKRKETENPEPDSEASKSVRI